MPPARPMLARANFGGHADCARNRGGHRRDLLCHGHRRQRVEAGAAKAPASWGRPSLLDAATRHVAPNEQGDCDDRKDYENFDKHKLSLRDFKLVASYPESVVPETRLSPRPATPPATPTRTNTVPVETGSEWLNPATYERFAPRSACSRFHSGDTDLWCRPK